MSNRRAFLGAGAALAAVSSFPLPARSADTVRVLSAPVEIAIELDYGKLRNFDEQSGLAVDVQYLNNGSATVAGILAGSAEVAVTTMITAISAHQKKIPISIIAAGALYTSKAPTTYLMVGKDATFQGARDFTGKIIGVDALKNITQVAVANWLDKNGGDSKSVHFVEMPFADMSGALATKRIDAGYISEPFATRARSSDAKNFAPCYDSIASSFLLGCWVAQNDWIAANPDIVRRFAAFVQKTAAYANANHDATLPTLVRVSKIDPAVAALMPRATFAERLNPALIKPVIDVGVKYDVVTPGLRPEELIAPIFR
jgi:NitT/TauT family transport system substrate-binding protein